MQTKNVMLEGFSLTLSQAILIYTRDQKRRMVDHIDEYCEEETEETPVPTAAYCSLHPVQDGIVGQGRCLTRQDIESLVKEIRNEKDSVRSVLPPELLCLDGGLMAWFRPSQVRPIYFKTRDDKFSAAMNNQSVIHPALLFLATGGSLSVYALDSNDRPLNDTRLFIAPYFNMYDSGRMCQGNARYPDQLSLESLPVWESAFWDTQFTHSNYGKTTLTTHPDGHDGLWRCCRYTVLDGLQPPFPVEYLSPAMASKDRQLTVRDAMSLAVGGAR